MGSIFENIRKPFSRPAYYPIQKGPKGNYIFIHINKTGGTSIDKALGLRKKHLTAQEVIDWVGKEAFSASFKFAVVRNPWDKVVSHYKFRIKNQDPGLTENPIDFTSWVKKTYGPEKDPIYYSNPTMFLPQVDWLKDHEGQIQIDEILRFERLSEEFDRIRPFVGGKKLPHVNKTAPTNYREFYDAETQKIISDWFAEDLALFGYTF